MKAQAPRTYRVRVADEEFTIRGLTRAEYLETIRRFGHNELLLQNYICGIATLTPINYNWDQSLAGVADSIAKAIWNVSGLSAQSDGFLQSFIKEANEWLESEEGKLEAIALATIPGLDLETLHHCDPPDRIKYLWLGQFNCQLFYGIDPQVILHPEEHQGKGATKKGHQLPN
jgi:hypothetical protein